MWLLNTARAELKFFPTPESVPGGYAVLSHVWDKQETTFQEIQTFRARCAQAAIRRPSSSNDTSSVTGSLSNSPASPRDLVSTKIRKFCILAEKDGYEWGWVDTCCINKDSSAELTEAINSMFRYYTLADVCYVYLSDVMTRSLDVLEKSYSDFRSSRWHRRGWTLQELIAPELVVFLSRSWELLGTKMDLAPLLESITKVPVDVLQLRVRPSDYCVAARMAWAANRETTRPEDEAYCLMGIFGIFMPVLYGEGKNAFRRLQEEIMRQIDDVSIFAWGAVVDGEHLADINLTAATTKFESIISTTSIFADSPSAFGFIGHNIEYPDDDDEVPSPITDGWTSLSSSETGDVDHDSDSSKQSAFSLTSYGLLAHIPVFQYSVRDVGGYIAVLSGTRLKGARVHIGLHLQRVIQSRDRSRPLYRISLRPSTTPNLFGHLVLLDEDLRIRGLDRSSTEQEPAQWRTIYIAHRLPSSRLPRRLHKMSLSLHAPFSIPPSHARVLQRSVSLTADTALMESPWTGDSPASLSFAYRTELTNPLTGLTRFVFIPLRVFMGICSQRRPHVHWATATLDEGEPATTSPSTDDLVSMVSHDCSEHHVDDWSNNMKRFTIYDPRSSYHVHVELTCKPYHLHPATRNVHITASMASEIDVGGDGGLQGQRRLAGGDEGFHATGGDSMPAPVDF
ncbi:heterokaryon incompatibility protein-domain-containing protein [Dichomitus squalens]|uniref:Heterokaryon incompatibility protein-domain-containing protein n=1 Tax=Dichomitus squalens TaxID=114155 RepID=A0A4Q9PJK9_9APHY|nr:heterokaryon incompatibility protein-domain-containing protein [Dichomitus squalens]